MEIHQLRYFCAVARSGSFVRAAEAESIAQPSLSQQIRKLEKEIGAPLFDRLGRSVRLTRHGVAQTRHVSTSSDVSSFSLQLEEPVQFAVVEALQAHAVLRRDHR